MSRYLKNFGPAALIRFGFMVNWCCGTVAFLFVSLFNALL